MNNSWLVNQEVEESSHMNKLVKSPVIVDPILTAFLCLFFYSFFVYTGHN